MAETASIASQEKSAAVRERVADSWRRIHRALRSEIAKFEAAGKPIPRDLVEMLRVCSDQIRRDYRLHRDPAAEETAPATEPASPADPLHGLKLVHAKTG